MSFVHANILEYNGNYHQIQRLLLLLKFQIYCDQYSKFALERKSQKLLHLEKNFLLEQYIYESYISFNNLYNYLVHCTVFGFSLNMFHETCQTILKSPLNQRNKGMQQHGFF